MGVGFNWFKDYKIIEEKITLGFGGYIEYRIKYLDRDCTSHGYGNRSKLQSIFRKYLNIEIPTIDDYYSTRVDLDLIKPSLMSSYCDELLDGKEYDLENMRDRIEYIKELSDDGYYISYDIL